MANAQAGGGYHTVGYQGAANTDDTSFISARHRTYPVASIGESGTANVNTGWLVVDLEGTYRSPVVFCGVPSFNGGEQSVCRIRRFRYSPPHQRVAMNPDGSQNNHAEFGPTTTEDDQMQCHDGTMCYGDGPNASPEGWACCAAHGGRAACPPNFPIMCAEGGDLEAGHGGASDGWCLGTPGECETYGGVHSHDICPGGKWCFEISLQVCGPKSSCS